ncbi:MAG: metal phosphate:H(+) symporter PitA [Candidatus Westeberhardia cardiocondylae]|nr:metal phosphate:H(+) symporter PitA [Candidatus Westeberhardia cardiocondylae]
MLHIFTSLDFYTDCILVVVFIFVLFYEIINGFHDTANAIATIVYTGALRPYFAVLISGICNFFGVFMGGLSVAYAIVHLLPMDVLVYDRSVYGLPMILSMLVSAILWNFGTWYFGLPSSSSHTLIGSIMGVIFMHALIVDKSVVQALNMSHLVEVLLSLIFSPFFGFFVSVFMLWCIRFFCKIFKYKFYYMHLTAEERYRRDGVAYPPWLIRFGLIISSFGVSFSHGANDGQKGIGLIMLVLMSIVPVEFVVNLNSSSYDIYRVRDSVINFYKYYIQNYDVFCVSSVNVHYGSFVIDAKKFSLLSAVSCRSCCSFSFLHMHSEFLQDVYVAQEFFRNNLCKDCDVGLDFCAIVLREQHLYDEVSQMILVMDHILYILKDLESYNQLNFDQRIEMRCFLVDISDLISKIISGLHLSDVDRGFLKNLQKDLLYTVEYAPVWVIFAVALSLSFGTMIGWKRVAITVGEKIGNKNMTYMQGLLVQMISAVSIGIASYIGKPVSTTHVLSSAVIGTMLVEGHGIQFRTVKNIFMAWILTFPVSMFVSGVLYVLCLLIVVFCV